MTNSDIKLLARITPAATDILNEASRQINLSARAYMRIIKVGRTIADLEQSNSIQAAHLSEAIQYRYQAPKKLIT